MEIKFTVRIKEKHNPPAFNAEMGKGVLATQVVDFKGATQSDLNSPAFQQQILSFALSLKDEWVEVIPDVVLK